MKLLKQFNYQILAGIVMMLALTSTSCAQSDEGYIYGEVTMIDGEKYKGAIRWDDEEAFWDDMFNSSKGDNQFVKYLDRDDMRKFESKSKRWDHNWGGFMTIWDNYSFASSHSFACRFGDIKTMKITGRERVKLEFKNGEMMRLQGGSNDVGTNINIYDEEIGKIRLKWDRIEEISFLKTPKSLKKKFGEPLYATVKTLRGELTGYIQWDHDECLDTDKLDGHDRNGKVSLEFGNIKSIEADGRGSKVTLKSGREMYLTGTNDVNSENRGIVVKSEKWGKALVGWRDFESITFEDPKGSGPGFDDFKTSKEISGTVVTVDGDKFSGNIVYDLDEAYDFEILDGKDDHIDYKIPFRKIKRVKPKNYNYTTVELKSGEVLLLGDSQDVTDKHDGVLVWDKGKNDEPKYIPWEKIKEINFD